MTIKWLTYLNRKERKSGTMTIPEKNSTKNSNLERLYPKYSRYIKLVKSLLEKDRMKGFALFTYCFRKCSLELQEFVMKKWKEENKIKTVDGAFLKYLDKSFQPLIDKEYY